MVSYAKRFLIVFVLAACIGLLFIAGKKSHETSSHVLKLDVPKSAWVDNIRKSQFSNELAFNNEWNLTKGQLNSLYDG